MSVLCNYSLEEHAESSKERRRKDKSLENNTDGGGMEEVLWDEGFVVGGKEKGQS
jgi:hypothetical protein